MNRIEKKIIHVMLVMEDKGAGRPMKWIREWTAWIFDKRMYFPLSCVTGHHPGRDEDGICQWCGKLVKIRKPPEHKDHPADIPGPSLKKKKENPP